MKVQVTLSSARLGVMLNALAPSLPPGRESSPHAIPARSCAVRGSGGDPSWQSLVLRVRLLDKLVGVGERELDGLGLDVGIEVLDDAQRRLGSCVRDVSVG